MFLWDSSNISHVAQHDISPAEAEQVIANNPVDLEVQLRNGEIRFPHVGETRDGRILVVIVTVRGEHIRVVTAFPASRNMRKFYLEQKGKQDAEDSYDT